MAAHEVWIVETTLPHDSASLDLARGLVKSRLAACANWAVVTSYYSWRGRVEEALEWHVSFKTAAARAQQLAAAIAAQHPYEVPFIAASPVAYVDPRYDGWVASETETGGTTSNPSV